LQLTICHWLANPRHLRFVTALALLCGVNMCVGFELPTSYQLVHPMELTQFELDWSELDRPGDSISELEEFLETRPSLVG
jgi:hypothetical protein